MRDKEKYNAYMAEYMRKQYDKNVEWVRQYKLDSGCVDCGYNDHPAALEFDHLEGRNGDQSRTIARLMGKSRKRLEQEIDLCEVVCANCHRITTFNRHQKMLQKVDTTELPLKYCKCGSEIDRRGRTERCRSCR